MNNLTTADIYKEYIKEYKSDISYKDFKNILSQFNKQVSNEIVKGYKFNMGFKIGTIEIRKIELFKPLINWGETNKLKQQLINEGKALYDSATGEGNKYMVYYTEEFTYQWHWFKFEQKVEGENRKMFPLKGVIFWSFKATKDNKRTKLAQAIDDLSPIRYKHGIQ